MSERIDEQQVRHIARLARLNLSDDEVRLFATQLGDILVYVRQLEAVNTEGVEPLTHAFPITNVTRPDEPGACLAHGRALANAPQREGAFFKVPAILDPGAGA